MRLRGARVDGALCIMHVLLTVSGTEWVHAEGRGCERHWCFLITAGVIEVFWIIS